MPKINITTNSYIKCVICSKQMEIKIYANPSHPDYLTPIVAHKRKITCSRECHTKWQQQIQWEERVGYQRALEIRKEKSEIARLNNPSKRPEVAKKISKSLTNYLKSNPGIRSGENNSFFGKKHTEEQKQKWSLLKKGYWAYNQEQKKRQELNTPKKENHPNWMGGISNGEYGLDFNKKLKETIKESYNFTCQHCFSTRLDLDVHHIDYDKTNNSLDNLIPLCKKCHGKTNYNREIWTELFLKNKDSKI